MKYFVKYFRAKKIMKSYITIGGTRQYYECVAVYICLLCGPPPQEAGGAYFVALCLSVCLSVRPIIYRYRASRRATQRITMTHMYFSARAAYRTAISAAQILVFPYFTVYRTLIAYRSYKTAQFCFHAKNLSRMVHRRLFTFYVHSNSNGLPLTSYSEPSRLVSRCHRGLPPIGVGTGGGGPGPRDFLFEGAQNDRGPHF